MQRVPLCYDAEVDLVAVHKTFVVLVGIWEVSEEETPVRQD